MKTFLSIVVCLLSFGMASARGENEGRDSVLTASVPDTAAVAGYSQSMQQVVITATRTPKLLKDAPIFTRVIPAGEIKKTDATHIGELLQAELPGIEFSYSMDQQVSLNMSGFSGNSVLFLIDGERLAGETLDNVDYNRLNLDNVERIEIIKGAASSLYGSNAVGGVVNIISRRQSEPWSANLNGRLGAHGERRYGGYAGFNYKKINSVTNVQYTSADAIDLSEGREGEQVGDYGIIYGNRTLNVKERIVYSPADGLNFTARAGYFFRERNSSESVRDRYRSFSGGLRGDWKISDRDALGLSYSFDQYDKSDYLLQPDLDIRDYSNVQHIFRTQYDRTTAAGNILTIGGDWMRDYLMSYQFAGNGSHVQYNADAFVQFDWSPSEKVNVITGARADYFSELQSVHFSPKLGVMYRPGGCTLRASYAGGFRSPTLKELYMNFFMGNIFMIYGNPALESETSHNFSLSAEYSKGRYNVTATGFCNFVDNRISTVWNTALNGQVYTNMSPLKIAGADIEVSARYSCGISWRLSYAYTREMIKDGEAMLSSARPHSATARLSYDKTWNGYSLGISLTGRCMSAMTADVYTMYASNGQTERRTYPGYSIWKLNISQCILRGITFNATVDNLFNYRPDYYYGNSPVTTGTAFSAGLSFDIERIAGMR